MVISGKEVLSGVQSSSHDLQVHLMEDECLVHILGRLSSGQLNPVCSRQIWDVLDGFSAVSLGQSGSTWNLQPLGCIIHSGLLIQMRVVLQGVSGGALQVVR